MANKSDGPASDDSDTNNKSGSGELEPVIIENGNDGASNETDNSGNSARSDATLASEPPQVVKKRGRGRPRKDGTQAPNLGVDPASPKATQGAKAARSIKPDIATVANYIMMGNNAMAQKLQNPVLVIGPQEAAMIAEPFIDVLEQYGIFTSKLSTPTARLAGALLMVYGMRIGATIAMKRASQQRPQTQTAPTTEPSAPGASNVVDFSALNGNIL